MGRVLGMVVVPKSRDFFFLCLWSRFLFLGAFFFQFSHISLHINDRGFVLKHDISSNPCIFPSYDCVYQSRVASVFNARLLMGAVLGLGSAKVNYCTGRGFWLHPIIA